MFFNRRIKQQRKKTTCVGSFEPEQSLNQTHVKTHVLSSQNRPLKVNKKTKQLKKVKQNH